MRIFLVALLGLGACGPIAKHEDAPQDRPRPDPVSVEDQVLVTSGQLCPAVDADTSTAVRATQKRNLTLRAFGCPATSAALTALGVDGDQVVYRSATSGQVVPVLLHGDVQHLRAAVAGLASVALTSTPPLLSLLDDALVVEREVSLAIPTVRDEALDTGFKDLQRFCYSRDVVLRAPNYYLDATVDVQALPGEQGYVALISTCGYVDALFLDGDGRLLARHTVFDGAGRTPLALVPLQASIVIGAPEQGVLVLAAFTPSWYDSSATPHRTLAVSRFSYRGDELAAYPALTPKANLGIMLAAAFTPGHPDDVVVTSNASRPIDGGPNDSQEDDVWLARVDLASGAIGPEVTTDVFKDDIPGAVAVAADGSIFVTGETAKHHVDTGSWFDGAQVLLLRYAPDLTLAESLSFGGARRDGGLQLLLGRSRVMVAGLWDGAPSNHSPPEESWWRSFEVTLPQSGWTGLAPTEP